MASVSKGPKNKRSSRACDRCYKKACKCYPGIEGTPCTRCIEGGMACIYSRQVKRRGPRSRRLRAAAEPERGSVEETSASEPAASLTYSPPQTASEGTPGTTRQQAHLTTPTTAQHPMTQTQTQTQTQHPTATTNTTTATAYDESIVTPELVERLTLNFYNASYPTRPYFHWPTYQAQIQSQAYRSDGGLFAVAMAVCAVSAARIAHGPTMPSDTPLAATEAAAISARCYAAADKALPTDVATVVDIVSMMKASALLASVCLQNSDLKRTLAHLGYYASLSVLNGFYNESNWPAGLNEMQKQERRRLFWGVYQQEQYVSNDFGLVSRQREAQATVLYPAEVFCDEDISATSVYVRPDRVSFLRGWNFCTNLYRLLENINSAVRARQRVAAPATTSTEHRDDPDSDIQAFLARFTPPKNFAPDSLQFITRAYDALPPELKQVRVITEEHPHADRYSIIACNILVTTQILKMLLVGNGESSVHQRCAIAGELLNELSSVPLAFFHATSMSSLRHLAHVGHMLASVIQRPLLAWTYLQVRSTLRVLADFLDNIEVSRGAAPHLSVKLRVQIDRIDQCMRKTSQQHPALDPGLRSVGQTLLQHWLQSEEPEQTREQTREQTCDQTGNQTSVQTGEATPPAALHSPPPSVDSSARPPDLANSTRAFDIDQQQQQQQQQYHQHNHDSHHQQQHPLQLHPPTTRPTDPVFRDATFDFMLQTDNSTTFSLDPLENWPLPLPLGDPGNDTFGLDIYPTTGVTTAVTAAAAADTGPPSWQHSTDT
ncbi:Transcription factor [Niveomyces insectorum RCEF 264]|uniref:Transcription factor n=1 Tax=Niveomyces insectorum RCEF 264 TaxID=1081102 RepID=A0A167Y053_9HYPO|nr:Transcription factor [Niveomyces insectorum RCEF 264]